MTLRIIREDDYTTAFDAVTHALLHQKVIVYPTDTLYGIGVNALDAEMMEKLYTIKERPQEKQISILVSDFDMLKRFCVVRGVEHIIQQLLPGPYTLVLSPKWTFPNNPPTIAVRIPKRRFITDVVRALGFPITATSANLSGHPAPKSVEELSDVIRERVDLIIDGGPLPGTPSTVIDLINKKILREGEGLAHAKKILDIHSRS